MFEFKNPLSRVCLSQAKTNAFHLPYREGKFVYFICLVLNLVWSLDATISQWWAFKGYLIFWHWWWMWRCEVISRTECYFWLFSLTPEGSKVSALLMSLLFSQAEASQFPFAHQDFILSYVETMVPEMQKDGNLATSTKLLSLVPWRIKVSLEALLYQYQTSRFSRPKRRCSVVVSFVQ